MKPPLQALPGPGEEASGNGTCHKGSSSGPEEEPMKPMKPTLQALEGPGELASC